MGKYIGCIYKHIKYQLSTPSINKPICSSSASQISSSIDSARTCVYSIIDKEKKYHPERFKNDK